jgi:glycosyltransferase involved in cell wall biosynthesis
MENRPFVSVVIPTFNRARQVQDALKSVLAQTNWEFEVIVVDDGSTDDTGEAIQRIMTSQPTGGTKIRYFFQSNQGSSVARNKGIDEARGEWIAFLDSDDIWLPNKLELQLQAMQRFAEKCGGCFTDAQMVNDAGLDAGSFRSFGVHFDRTVGIASDALSSIAKTFCGFWLSTLLVRTDLAKRIGGFDPGIVLGEDRDFYFRLALVTSLVYVNQPLARTDRSPSPPGSTSRPWDKWHVRLRSHQRMYEKWLDLPLPPEVHKIVVQDLRLAYSHWTNWYLANEQYDEARRAVSNALHYGLTFGLAIKWIMAHFVPGFARTITRARGSDNAVYSR